MADDFIVNNPGVSSVFLTNLGVEIPASEDFDLLRTHDLELLQSDSELAGHLSAGTLVRKIGGVSLSPGDSLADAGPVEAEQQAWKRAVITITAPGQTALNMPTSTIDPDSIRLEVNGVVATETTDYTYATGVITWLDTEYTLDANDKVVVIYLEGV